MAEAGKPPLLGRLTSGQWLAVGSGGLAVVALAAIVVSLLAFGRQSDRRELLLERLDPSVRAAQRLAIALVDEETAVRGFARTGRDAFAEPIRNARAESSGATADLRRRLGGPAEAELRADLARAERAVDAWQSEVAVPAAVAALDGDVAEARRLESEGRARFDAARAALAALQRDLLAARTAAVDELEDATRVTRASIIAAGVLLLLSTLVLWLTLRRAVGVPLGALAGAARRVSRGEYELEIPLDGSRDVRDLTADIERMRGQIVHELAALEAAREQLEQQAAELQRSNEELEQFAYVASHDLQEPLRKVTSFCQMLERRYSGQLDDRADQYIAFAVDGAKRMQVLINDLLAFSRVGRVGVESFSELELRDAVDAALANLAGPIEETGAEVVVADGLPRVRGDAALLAAVFQNLVGNAIKFRGEETPRVTVTPVAAEDGGLAVEVADNGIGIDPEYADRIFVIFQRLHAKDAYPGTGIGLAMARKIVEYHGGTIRLAPGDGSGSTFRLEFPAPERPDDA